MKSLPLAAALLAASASCAAARLDPTPFVRHDSFQTIEISPDGQYLAATVQMEDRRTLAILRTADRKVTGGINLGRNMDVLDYWWVGPDRVVASVAQKIGAEDQPQPTGELIGMNADGSRSELLVGQRAYSEGVGTHIKGKKGDVVAAFLLDDLPNDDEHVLITTEPFVEEPLRKVERMNVYNGRREVVTTAPVRNARFLTDNRGQVRYAWGHDVDNELQLWHRADDEAAWKRVDRPDAADAYPIGFSTDDSRVYLQVEREDGPDIVVEQELASGKRRTLLQDDDVDPHHYVRRVHSREPIGAFYFDGKPRTAYFDDASPEARLQRSLEAAFAGNVVQITSRTDDGNKALVFAWSDRNPGDFYLFDVKAKKADYLLSRRDWLDPATMAEVRPIQLKARDGLALHGLLTLPPKRAEKALPMVVVPHGGPYRMFDAWGFEPELQYLAAAGYAVLQVNFRGSGNYGVAFYEAGQQEWGGKMQDDITDATRWAIAQGIADPKRICIHGASYGGYAALMGAAREPELYRCASGYVGVYDLALMHEKGDVQERESGATYLREWIGEGEDLEGKSPVGLAGKIKVPVLLAAGGEDERAPIVHSKRMEKALKAAGVPVQARYYSTEGHGFYDLEHRQEYFGQLLDFLDRHLGGGAPAAAAPAKP
jgi:dipeptidyl aminopeptidase/acylaminoacyl peptidase